MVFPTIFLLCFFISLSSQLTEAKSLTAIAVIHEHDDIWGSIIFRQASPSSPVTMQTVLEDVNIRQNQRIEYAIHEEPVHYDKYQLHERCGEKALGPILSASGRQVGYLSERHRKIGAKRFAQVVHDKHISLYNDTGKSIISKSFVVRQGKGEADYRCATIEIVDDSLAAVRAGFVPCEMKQYDNCLVGTADPSACVYRPCSGYQRFWGPVTKSTQMCIQKYETYPKALANNAITNGRVRCKHGRYSLLQPIRNAWLL